MKSFLYYLRNAVIILCVFMVVFSSCRKDDDHNNPFDPNAGTLKTTVIGTVKDTDNKIVKGALVRLGNYTALSDDHGIYAFINVDVPKERMVLSATKSGFFNCIKAKKTQTGDVNYLNLMMEEKPVAVSIQSTSGGVVNISGGAQITFAANAFVDANGNAYSGAVKVFARHINPGNDNFESIIPGGDLLGISAAGSVQSLQSFGMVEAILTDNGGIAELKLAPGSTAEIKFPIDPSLASQAQATIPLWHLDEATGLWKEEGQAIKSGNNFVGSVSHFSTWNCDYPGERTDLTGKVIDCQGAPVANIVVTINGFLNVTTNNSGVYSTWVPAGFTINCQALASNNNQITISSNVSTIVAQAGQLNIVPDLVLPCATRIAGTISNCSSTALVPGIVYASWNGGTNIVFSGDGIYSIPVPENTYINISSSHFGMTGSASVLSGQSTTTQTAPPVKLCTGTTSEEFRFTLNKNGVSTNYVVDIDNYTVTVSGINSMGVASHFNVQIHGFLIPGNKSVGFYVDLTQQTNNYFLLGPVQNIADMVIDSIGTFYTQNINQGNTTNKFIFTDYGVPGSVISGIFEFDSGNTANNVTNASFRLYRDN